MVESLWIPCHAFQITYDFHYECTWVEWGLSHSMLGGMLSGFGLGFLVMIAMHFIKHTMVQTWKEPTSILLIIKLYVRSSKICVRKH
jgi:hypothetical protein